MRVRSIAALCLLIPALTIAPTTGSVASASEPAVTAQKVTFVVENMSCALCPVTIRTAIARVRGVKSVEVDFKTKTATVVFDPTITTVEAIAAASTNAGYPARPASN